MTPTLGEVLREGRHRRNVSLEQAEADTKIRKKYLLALEEDDYVALPVPVYARGFIQIYATYLGIDPLFAEKLYQPPTRVAQVQTIQPAASGLREMRFISMSAVVIFLLSVAGVAAVVFLYAQYLSYSASVPSEPAAAKPTAAAIGTPTARPAAAVMPTAAPTATPSPSPTPVRSVEVTVTVIERTWLRVLVDGQSQPTFEGELQAGTVRSWTARDKMDMRVGNAGGVEVAVNGMRQGKLGASGEVKNVTWGRQ